MRKEQPLKLVLTEDGSHTLFNPNLNETYHSLKGALSESQYVFIQVGLEYIMNRQSLTNIHVFEVGFGTGLNTFLTKKKLEKTTVRCEYQAVETRPLLIEFYSRLNYFEGTENEEFQMIHHSDWNRPTEIFPDFVLSKLECSLEQVELLRDHIDLIYFDAFAPSRQPEIWDISNLKKCWSGLKSGGVFVTYCAQGQFKRDMAQLGFDVQVLPGALGKKEMIRAVKQ